MLRRGPGSVKSHISDAQARLFALIIRQCIEELRAGLRLSARAEMPLGRDDMLDEIPSMVLLGEAAVACGFVCRDLRPSFNLSGVQPAMVGEWDLATLRRYLHTLFRADRWNEGGGPRPLYESMRSGTLAAVAERLDSM